MRPLVIDQSLKDQIAKLVAYAEANPHSMDDLLDIKNGALQQAGDVERHTLILPFGYKIVFSIENQPIGLVRHLSMSVDSDNVMPNPAAVQEIMDLIGFNNALLQCDVWIETYAPKRKAINVLEVFFKKTISGEK